MKTHFLRLVLPLLLVATSRSASTDDLAWLTGHWRGTSTEGAVLESFYTTPEGGVVLGASKEFKNGRCVFFDVELFHEKEGQLFLQPHPNGRPSSLFPLTSIDRTTRKATFANRRHDWPQEFVYQRVDDRRLIIVLSGPGKDGKELRVEYAFSLSP